MGEPEHIRDILKRVFVELEQYFEKGGCPQDRKREAPIFPARHTAIGAQSYGWMDQAVSTALNEWMVKKP